jgi:AraC family ethanolamine operon transcriptional activator
LGDILPLLIDAIPRRAPNFCLTPHPQQQARLVRRATDYIEAHIHAPLTLKDLYTELGVSRRTLFYSFERVFGVTPMEYIKVQRLQGVHRALKAADPNLTSIVAIAHRWGFWHSGQFAKAYKTMFGELPSETLQKS